MKIKLSKNQETRVNYHIKRTENKIKEIKKEHYIREDTSSLDRYILHRTLVITVMKIMIKDMFYYFIRNSYGIFLDEECNELKDLIRKLRDKIIEEDNKLEDIYERIITAKKWMNVNCR